MAKVQANARARKRVKKQVSDGIAQDRKSVV